MPTYSYVCDACEHKFDHFQSMSDETLKTCPQCHKPRLRRLIGAGAGLIFKGSGFYITDYARQSSKSGNGQDKSDKSDKPVKTDDHKPAGKKQSTPKDTPAKNKKNDT